MSVTQALCQRILDFIRSETVSASLETILPEAWNASMRWEFVSDAADLESMTVSVVPGSLTVEKMGRDAMTAAFEVGVQFSRRIASMTEIPQNVEFLETLLKHLARLSSFTGIDGCRGADVLSMNCSSLYANQEMEGTRIFDALIVLNLKIYFTKGQSNG